MAGSFSPSEVVDLILAVTIGPAVIVAAHRARLPRLTGFYWVYAFMLVAYVTTIAEGFVAPVLMNVVEHLCYGLAGISAAWAVWRVATAPDNSWWASE